jgi:hypothetical protein
MEVRSEMDLTQMIESGRRYLIVGQQRVKLTSREQMLFHLTKMSPIWAVFDLGGGRDALLRLAGPASRIYDVGEVAAAAGVSIPTISMWCREKIIRASVRDPGKRGARNARLFSFEDTLIATTLGSLRRQAVPYKTTLAVAKYLYSLVTEDASNAVGV